MAFSVTNTFTANTTAEAAKVNTNFSEIETELNAFPTDGALASACVDTAQLASDAVTTVKITDANVTTAKLAADAVTAAKLADDAVVNDNIDTSGAFSIFGTWTSNDSTSTALANDEVYKAETDGIICAHIATSTATICYGYTDSSNPPTTIRVKGNVNTYHAYDGFTFPVKKDNYVKITGMTTIYWLPIGTGGLVKQ